MKTLPCACGRDILLDDEDHERLQHLSFSCRGRNNVVRTLHAGDRRNMARFIIHVPDGLEPDHIDRNNHNNQKLNLRAATRQQQIDNRSKNSNGNSQFKGVHFYARKGKWIAQICHDYDRIHLGSFDSEIDAAKAYNKAAIELKKEFAVLNPV